MASSFGITVRAFPTLLRIGLAESVAYRAEMIVWMLSTTMPLVNLALWHGAAAGAPIGQYGQSAITAYFLSSFIVRQLTGSWVVWEMNMELRSGRLSMRLLRPVHPLLAYAAENLSAIPLRAAMSLPVAVIAFFVAGGAYGRDGVVWLAAALALVGAWLMMFLIMAIVGTVGFFTESSASLMYIWQALFFTLSGYIFPLDFLAVHAPRLTNAIRALPFYFQNGFPIELLLGKHTRASALHGLAIQWAYVLVLFFVTRSFWRAGVRRWNAYGA